MKQFNTDLKLFTLGSFVCECPLGLELTEDGKRCKVNCDEFIRLTNLIFLEKLDLFLSQDIDECGRTSGVCSNGVCENMMGAYQCVCDEGFKQVSLA